MEAVEIITSLIMNQPTLFNLEAFTNSPVPPPLYDPAWDEIEVAPQHPQPETRWNPADFGEVPRKVDDGGQISIFWDDSGEPPDPDDYLNREDYEQAWAEWEILVGGQAILATKKVAHQHDTHWIERYWVERTGNKYWYYRYCWRVGRKKKRCYIGSVSSIIAKRKKADVEIWIRDGLAPVEIENLIRSWRSP